MGIISALKKLFKVGTVKVENGINSLITAEDQLKVVYNDTIKALDAQKENSIKLEAQKEEFDYQYAAAKKQLSADKTRCKVLKNRLIENNKNPDEDDDLKLAAMKYLDQESLVKDMDKQKEELDLLIARVEKMLRRLRFNKQQVEMKTSLLS